MRAIDITGLKPWFVTTTRTNIDVTLPYQRGKFEEV